MSPKRPPPRVLEGRHKRLGEGEEERAAAMSGGMAGGAGRAEHEGVMISGAKQGAIGAIYIIGMLVFMVLIIIVLGIIG